MICDRCGKDVGYVQKFHAPYASYIGLKQINGYCAECWEEIVNSYGTWREICLQNAIKPFVVDKHSNEDKFEREFYISSAWDKEN